MTEESFAKKVEGLQRATLAGGCFWCLQPSFDELDGVEQTIVGYTGGDVENPSYQDVCTGTTGHYEAIDVFFDPKVVSFEQVLDVYWKNIDPTQPDGQFADIGPHYRTVIFYHDDEQHKKAEESKQVLEDSGKFNEPIATAVLPSKPFYPAEEYHQEYYRKNASHYNMYKVGSGRAGFIQETWGK